MGYDYRADYFRKHKGVFGRYQCPYCFHWFKKEDMDVDHIWPKNKMGVNAPINTIAACAHCNRSKKDKIDSRVIQGYAMKTAHETLGTTGTVVTSGVTMAGKVGVGATTYTVKTGFKLSIWLAKLGLRVSTGIMGIGWSILGMIFGLFTSVVRIALSNIVFTVIALFVLYTFFLNGGGISIPLPF